MRVAVVGTGNMAMGLGRQFAAGGHEVIVGSRDPERAEANAEEIGAAGHGSYEEAVEKADAFLLAVNWTITRSDSSVRPSTSTQPGPASRPSPLTTVMPRDS